MKYQAMFGRYQPWHKGHQWLLDELIDDNPEYGVWIGVRNIFPDKDNPYHPNDVIKGIRRWLRKNRAYAYHKVRVTLIPDIEGIHYGRKVGWNIIEHIPPDEIGQVSATKIREKNEKIAANYGKKDDAIPAGPLANGVNLAEEGVSDRDG